MRGTGVASFPFTGTFVALEDTSGLHPINPLMLLPFGAVQDSVTVTSRPTAIWLMLSGAATTLVGSNTQFAPTWIGCWAVPLPGVVVVSVTVYTPLAGNDVKPPMPLVPLVGFEVHGAVPVPELPFVASKIVQPLPLPKLSVVWMDCPTTPTMLSPSRD